MEICEEVGEENMFLFGLRIKQVQELRPVYSARAIYHADPEVRRAIDMIRRNVFCLLNPGLFTPIVRSLLDYNDHYMILADLRDYIETQDRIDALYRQQREWDGKALLNVARAGRFSSDRTVLEYARDIWHIEPVNLKQD